MSARPSAEGRRLAAGALAGAKQWLVEPPEGFPEPVRAPVQDRLAVAVVGLGPKSGTTTVARGLGTELAVRDAAGACAVTAVPGSVLPLGTPAAGRLARSLASLGHVRACGRLCLIDAPDRVALVGAAPRFAPLVFDVGDPRDAAAVAALADRVVLVGGPAVEPALAGVVAASLERVGPRPLVVASRPPAESRWPRLMDIEFPYSRLGAQWALAGREARGALGAALAALAGMVQGWE